MWDVGRGLYKGFTVLSGFREALHAGARAAEECTLLCKCGHNAAEAEAAASP